MKTIFTIVSTYILLIILVNSPLAADNVDIPLNLQLKLLIKASTYNRSQAQKNPELLNIGLIYTKDPHSTELADKIFILFGDGISNVRKFKVKFEHLLYQNPASLKQETEAKSINIFYIAPGNSKNLEDILNISQKLKILTITGVPDYVYEGVTLGVRSNGSRPEFIFNRLTARTDGTDFDSNFLRMVKVVNR